MAMIKNFMNSEILLGTSKELFEFVLEVYVFIDYTEIILTKM